MPLIIEKSRLNVARKFIERKKYGKRFYLNVYLKIYGCPNYILCMHAWVSKKLFLTFQYFSTGKENLSLFCIKKSYKSREFFIGYIIKLWIFLLHSFHAEQYSSFIYSINIFKMKYFECNYLELEKTSMYNLTTKTMVQPNIMHALNIYILSVFSQ